MDGPSHDWGKDPFGGQGFCALPRRLARRRSGFSLLETTIAAALYAGDPADDVKIELEYLKLRLEELIARDRDAAQASTATPATAGNFIGPGEIPSPACEDVDAASAEDHTGDDPSSSSASGPAEADEEVPPPPLPPPGGWGPAEGDDAGSADVEDTASEVRLDDFGDTWYVDTGSPARTSKLRRNAMSLLHMVTHQPKKPLLQRLHAGQNDAVVREASPCRPRPRSGPIW